MSLDLGKLQRSKNTADLVADALRSAILQGKLSSGQQLKQDEIAAQFKVSKIPVREALVQLQAEGLVRLFPNRGAEVSALTVDDIAEIYTIRSSLEPIALQRAVPHLKAADFTAVENILGEIDHEEDMTRWAELNWAFHERLYQPARLPRLVSVTQMLYNNVAPYLLQNYLDAEYLQESQRQHRAIVDACRDGDAELAVKRLLDHLGDPLTVFDSLLNDEN